MPRGAPRRSTATVSVPHRSLTPLGASVEDDGDVGTELDHRATGSAPTGRLAQRLGFPIHALVSAVPLGILLCSTAFDLVAQVVSAPCNEYPRASFLTAIVGVVAGVVAGFTGLPQLLRLRRDSPQFRAGALHVGLTDAALIVYGVSIAMRVNVDTCIPTQPAPLALSLTGAALIVVGAALGARLTYTHRVGSMAGDVAAAPDADGDGDQMNG